MKSQTPSLTRYAKGSLGELLTIAWPLILASATNMLMMLGDRVVLSRFSQEAFNANVGATPWIWTFFIAFLNIVMIAEVFVGRFNGAREYEKIGSVVWQMVWFSLATFIPLIPIALNLVPHLLAENIRAQGAPYLTISLLFLPIGLIASGPFAAFFTGRGKTKTVSIVVLISNIVNIIADIILVFGWGPIPSMGIVGAAWGTGIAEILSLIIFGWMFLQKQHRKLYNTGKPRWNRRLFMGCLSIGIPNAISAFINFTLWSWIIQVMADDVSPNNFAAFGITTTIYNVFFFMVEGVGQAVCAIQSNALGAADGQMICNNVRSWLKWSLISASITFIVMVVYPRPMIALLADSSLIASSFNIIHWMLILSWLAFCFGESLGFNFRNMLTAYGDTKFSMIANLLTYGGIVVPIGYFALKWTHDSSSFLAVEIAGQFIFLMVFFLRYRLHWLPKFRKFSKPITLED